MAASSTEMLMNSDGLVVNAYHDAAGRGDYFPGSAGTSEGQFLFIIGNLKAYQATGNPIAKEMAELALKNLLKVVYRNMPVPTTDDTIKTFAPHWLFNVKYEFDSSVIHYDRLFQFTNGVGYVNSNSVRYVYGARSQGSTLLWQNPYSPLTSGTAYSIASHEVSGGQEKVTLTIPFTGILYVTFSDQTGPAVQVNEPFEAWPDWRKLDPGEIACAVDVLVWAYRAFLLAGQVFNNPTWTSAAAWTRYQAGVAYDINDSRDWLKPSWAKSPFASGSRFSYQTRSPAARFSVNSDGAVVITCGRDYSGTPEVQYGNASLGDAWGGSDATEITAYASVATTIEVHIYPTASSDYNNRYTAVVALTTTQRTISLTRAAFKNPAGQFLPLGMSVYTVSISTRNPYPHSITIFRIRQTPNRTIRYSPGAIPFTANFQGNPAQLIDWRGPIYMGYQSPYMWRELNNTAGAVACVAMLRASQAAWRTMAAQTTLGPFAPVFIFDRTDAVQYGAPNTFTWQGPDPNTRWGGYQYRPLPELLEAALNETVGTVLYTNSIQVARDFIYWLAQDWAWLPMWAPLSNTLSDTIEKTLAGLWAPGSTLVLPTRPPLGPPTDYPQGKPEINYPEPHMTALILRSVLMLDKIDRPNGNATTATMDVRYRAILSKCMGLLSAMYVKSGQMAGTFSAGNNEWYGFWHGEILTTLAHAYNYTKQTNIVLPAVSEQCRVWMEGMLVWSKANVRQAAADFTDTAWKFSPNWSAGISEDFEFSTNIYEAFSGREQRLSLRVEPRRAVTMRHALVDKDARAYDAVLRLRQNLPMRVPQWHLAARAAVDAPVGQNYLIVDTTDLLTFEWGNTFALLQDSNSALMLTLESITGNRVNLTTGLSVAVRTGDRIAPALNGLIDQDVSASRLTGTVLDTQVKFRMLPQSDRRTLPVVTAPMTFTVGADTREVIIRRPNWAKEISVDQSWAYNTSETYVSGPIIPINGRNKGARTVKATWTLRNRADVDDFLSMIWRLKGRRYACWLPSWTDDFTLTRRIANPARVYVNMNAFLELGIMNDPAVGIFIRLYDGRSYAARVTNYDQLGADEAMLYLDRNLVSMDMSEVQMVSLLYRVRQVSDTATLNWVTNTVAETSVSFVSVYDEI